MATDLREQYFKAAAAGVSAMEMAGSPQEMQIALAMMCSHICMTYGLNGDALRNGLLANMQSIATDRSLLERQTNYINGFLQEMNANAKSPSIVNLH